MVTPKIGFLHLSQTLCQTKRLCAASCTLFLLRGNGTSAEFSGCLWNCKSQRAKQQELSRCLENMAALSTEACALMERSVRERVPPLLTDLYQFTMAYAYWRAGRHQQPAVFEMFFRDNPFDGGFSLFAGLHDCLLFLRSFRFTDQGEDSAFFLIVTMTLTLSTNQLHSSYGSGMFDFCFPPHSSVYANRAGCETLPA